MNDDGDDYMEYVMDYLNELSIGNHRKEKEAQRKREERINKINTLIDDDGQNLPTESS